MNDAAYDGQLIERIAHKDSDALGKLYDRYEQVIYSFACQIVKDPRAAEEVMQELFLRIWKSAGQSDAARSQPSAWMFAVTRSIALEHLHRQRPAEDQPDGETEVPEMAAVPEDITEEQAEMLMIGEQVREALRELSRDQQQVLDLIYYQGLTQQEAADFASIPPGTVKSRVRMAMRQLRKRLIRLGRREHAHD
ncbi:RNA polymerase subunit sigma-24 [Paenibacillus sp. PK3_47]|uniref:RNA polymerase sigma factor n=1 Tax=Paenibacillus sp. PK3_47 TaxID=2072642 RepID=UPI00201D3B6A|nr:sigma-70 family RNA polymerase sigma factor [Paenibacillus sp. PK3_47]UQZ34083.1 RNA polymerase subunit sigma-24 [Paenibacillus sp. PK3_47]